MAHLKNIVLGLFIVSVATNTINAAPTHNLRVKMVVEESGEVLTDIVPSALTETMDYISTGEFRADSTFMFKNLPERKLLIGYHIDQSLWCDSVPLPIPQELFFVYVPQKLVTRVRDKNFMIFNQAKDIEYWAAFQGRLIYLYSLVLLIPEDKLPV